MKLTEDNFIKNSPFQSIRLIHLVNKNGLSVDLTNYGARIVSLCVPSKNGELTDVVLGFDTLDKYLNAKEKYHGCIIGRYANRIAEGKFSIEDQPYTLAENLPHANLHGGVNGWHKKVWNVEEVQEQKVVFSCFSPDMEEGFPGNVNVKVEYELTNENTLAVRMIASTDKACPINMTNHSYFNLSGEGSMTAMDHILKLHCTKFTPVDDNVIPTGEMSNVHNSPFDFTSAKTLEKDINNNNDQLRIGNGYDHNFIIDGYEGSFKKAAEIYSPISNISMTILTSQPGIQLYTANWLDGSDIGKSGIKYGKRSAFCLETQHFPNSPNEADFPDCIVPKDQEYNEQIMYIFDVH